MPNQVFIHDEADGEPENPQVFFEIRDDIVDRVYAIDPNGTFCQNLRVILEQADRYRDLHEAIYALT